MENVMVIPKGTSLKVLRLVGKRIEKALLKEFGHYNPSVCWQLLDDVLTMQILIRIENGHILFGRVDFSSDVSDENAQEYSLRFYSSLPEEPFRYNEKRLLDWSGIEKNIADYLLRIKLSPYLVKSCRLSIEDIICIED